MSMDADSERLKELLVPQIVAWADAHWLADTVYALGLAFSAGWPPIPAPGLATVATREALMAEPDEFGVGLLLWNPAEFDVYDPDFVAGAAGDEAEELAGRLNETWEQSDEDSDEPWFEFMGDVAERLRRHDWSAYATSDDFVVISIAPLSHTTRPEIETQLARSVRDSQKQTGRRNPPLRHDDCSEPTTRRAPVRREQLIATRRSVGACLVTERRQGGATFCSDGRCVRHVALPVLVACARCSRSCGSCGCWSAGAGVRFNDGAYACKQRRCACLCA
jgi:hypothetical protein